MFRCIRHVKSNSTASVSVSTLAFLEAERKAEREAERGVAVAKRRRSGGPFSAEGSLLALDLPFRSCHELELTSRRSLPPSPSACPACPACPHLGVERPTAAASPRSQSYSMSTTIFHIRPPPQFFIVLVMVNP